MKHKLFLTTGAALLLATGASSAQQSADVKVETQVVERSRPDRFEQDPGRRAAEEQRRAVEKAESVLNDRSAAYGGMPAGMGGGAGGQVWFGAGEFPRGGGSRALLLVAQPPNDETRSAAQEDAAVMLRLLEKATRDDRRDDPVRAMGIPIEALGRQGPQAIYLDGFGALFLLNVDYPLVAPPAGDGEPRPKTESDSEWERTRRELYGRPGRPQPPHDGEGQPFDPARVDRLKSGLIDTLANATNLRQVTSDETVVVSVTGPGNSAGGRVRVFSSNRGGGGAGLSRSETRVEVFDHETEAVAEAGGGRAMGARQTQLTLRVQKSDIDAFAKQEITRDTFAQRVKVVAY